jgi:hypothetical protein
LEQEQLEQEKVSEAVEELSEEEKSEMLKGLVRKCMFEAARAGDIDKMDDLLDFVCADINMTWVGPHMSLHLSCCCLRFDTNRYDYLKFLTN